MSLVSSISPSKPMAFRDIVEHFAPSWFAAVMGTAVLPSALSFLPFGGAQALGAAILVFATILFLLILIPWVLKFIWAPASVQRDLDHPVAANFYPTMPISLVLLSVGYLKYPELLGGGAVAFPVAYALWLFGVLGIYGFGLLILARIFANKNIGLQFANFGWYIPPVSKLIIPVAGFELAHKMPEFAEMAFLISVMSMGVGFFLFLFVGANVYHRYLYHELPASRLAPTFFIGISPSALISVDLFKLSVLLKPAAPVSVSGSEVLAQLSASPALESLLKLLVLASWGFSLWWFMMGVLLIIHYMAKEKLPFALSWWAFTFPTGALAVSTGVAWKSSGFESLQGIYMAVLSIAAVIWLIVLARTSRGVISKSIFAPAH